MRCKYKFILESRLNTIKEDLWNNFAFKSRYKFNNLGSFYYVDFFEEKVYMDGGLDSKEDFTLISYSDFTELISSRNDYEIY